MWNLNNHASSIPFSSILLQIFFQFTILVFLTNTGLAQNIFSEDWETGMGTWYADNGLWEAGVPTVGPTTTHSGINCVGTNLSGNYPPSADTRLISPQIILPTPSGIEKIQLKFWQWFSSEDNYDKCVVQISENSGPWENLSDDIFEGSSTAWTQYVADLTSYAATSIRIGFYFTSNTGNGVSSGFYIDDISVELGIVNFHNPDDFEMGVGNWSADNGLWQVGVPTVGPTATHSGINCVGTNLNGNYPPYANTRFISPSITIPTPTGNEKIILKFWQWFSSEDNYDKCVVQISENSGDWENLTDDIFEGSSTAWTQYIADLTSYAATSIRIGFYFTTNSGNGVSTGFYLDDILIETEEITFPNPEDFELGVGNWYADNGLWQVGVPTVGPTATHSGINCAGTILNGNYPPNANTRLISPEITLTPITGQNPMLFFYQWYITEDNYDLCNVQVSVDYGDWQTVSNPISGNNSTWSQYGLDLSAFIDSTIRIGFYFTSNGGNGIFNGWYIDDIRIEGIVTDIRDNQNENLNTFSLLQNYPNPFNPSTIIKYQLPKTGFVILKVYDVLGNEVVTLVDGEKSAGSYELEFDASGLASGIYFYLLHSGSFVQTRKMILMK